MIDYKDYEDEKGNVNWQALEKARVEAGEHCKKCSDFIVSSIYENTPKKPTLCGSCETLSKNKNEAVEHEKFIRCPKCGYHEDVTDPMDHSKLYEYGEHEVQCEECDHVYEVDTRIEMYFTSPKMIEEAEDGKE